METSSSVPMWAFMALLGVIQAIGGLMVMRLWKAVDDNTDAVTKLSIALPTEYASKDEVNRHHDDDQKGFDGVKAHMNELREKVSWLDTRVAVIDGRER